MPIESRSVQKGEPLGFAPPEEKQEKQPTTSLVGAPLRIPVIKSTRIVNPFTSNFNKYILPTF